MKLTWTRCPHCNNVLNFNAEGGSGSTQDFGAPEIYRCHHCYGLVSNGMKEWGQLTLLQRANAIFRTVYTILLFGVGSGGIISTIAMFSLGLDEDTFVGVAVALIIFSIIVCTIIYTRSLTREIEESNERLRRSGT